MPLILPGNVASATAAGYEVANSLRVNDDDSPRLYKSNGTPTSRRKFTFSCWVKRSSLDEESDMHMIFDINGNDNRFYIGFFGDKIRINGNNNGVTTNDLKTNRIFKDFSAWYHICVAVDTEQGTAANRVKLYVNGTQETSFTTETYYDEDEDTAVDESDVELLEYKDNPGHYLDGYLAEVVYIDGSQEAVTSFGEFDSNSPTIWKPIDVSGLTFGTNGFYLDFEDSDNLGNDANGGTDFTGVNLDATDSATDTPTNNFCTLNPLSRGDLSNNAVLSQGNNYYSSDKYGYNHRYGTMGASNGKWYWEMKYISHNMHGNSNSFGMAQVISGQHMPQGVQWGGQVQYEYSYAYYSIGPPAVGEIWENNSGTLYGATILTALNQIGMVAMDLDNNRVYFGVDGIWTASGDPAAGSNGYTIVDASITPEGFYFPVVHDRSVNRSYDYAINFGGCPAFTISSGNADGNDYGNFEYAVPSGFYALCTKNLAEFG